jgi:hypothetical protein
MSEVRPPMNAPQEPQNSELRKYKWLKWTQRIFLILSVIMPAFFTLGYFLFRKRGELMEWDVLIWTIFILPWAILAGSNQFMEEFGF